MRRLKSWSSHYLQAFKWKKSSRTLKLFIWLSVILYIVLFVPNKMTTILLIWQFQFMLYWFYLPLCNTADTQLSRLNIKISLKRHPASGRHPFLPISKCEAKKVHSFSSDNCEKVYSYSSDLQPIRQNCLKKSVAY